jgi:tyrosinase
MAHIRELFRRILYPGYLSHGLIVLFRYWDETRDASKFSASPVFDPNLGFGGTGSGTGACLQNGPFKNMTVNIGPGFTTKPRCVNRQITDFLGSLTNQAAVTKALTPKTYEEAWVAIYNGPHLGGHMALSMMVRCQTVFDLT